jgi:hypothetical protein
MRDYEGVGSLDAVGNSEREFMNIVVTHLTQKKTDFDYFFIKRFMQNKLRCKNSRTFDPCEIGCIYDYRSSINR